jgi:TPR repeat protein
MADTLITGVFKINRWLRDAANGALDACFELGIAYASGQDGIAPDYVEAHKWFNLAAMSGDERAQQYRADLAAEMSAREIALAQRAARDWLVGTNRKAA